jgi:hypothetical protein
MTATEVMEQDYINRAVSAAAERLAAEIDFQVMADMLCEVGWSKVILKPMRDEKSSAIDRWCETHCKKHHQTMGLVWIFEDHGDAVNFALKWAD